jgi:VIT1/CCC1 family predicted Fe2+/Mn2+ transporter
MAEGTAPSQWSASNLKEMELNYCDEVSSRWIYSTLAEQDRDRSRAELFRNLAAYEEKHAGHWADFLRKLNRPVPHAGPSLDHRILARLARIFGVGFVMPFLHREEVNGIERYREQSARWNTPDAQQLFRELLSEEVAHEIETLESIRSVGNPTEGALRSVILGSIDGSVSVVALVTGVAGATGSSKTVLIAGVAALIAGTLSMMTAEYVSVKAEHEVRTSQKRVEQHAISFAPETKKKQLVKAYEEKGLTNDEAKQVVHRLYQNPPKFLQAVLADRHGIHGHEQGRAGRKGMFAGAAFAVSGMLPVLPFLFLNSQMASLLAVIITGIALFIAGIVRALTSLQPFLKSGIEMFGIGMGAAAVTYLIGVGIGGFIH